MATLLVACGARLSPIRTLEGSGDLEVSGQASALHTIRIPAQVAVALQLRSTALDVRAQVVNVDGRGAVRAADAPNDRAGVITVYLPPAGARTIQVRVLGQDHRLNHGRVHLDVLALPRVTAGDRRHEHAMQLLANGCVAFGGTQPGPAAGDSFVAAAQELHAIGDRAGEGEALLLAAGARYAQFDAWKAAGQLAHRAAGALVGAGQPAPEVRAIRLEGAARNEQAAALTGAARASEYAAARERLGTAAALADQRHLAYEAAYAYSYRGVAQQYEGHVAQARADYERALARFRAAGHAPGVAMATDSLAWLHYENGELREALARFDEALELSSPADSPLNYAYTLYNSAIPLRVMGRFDEAIARYQQSADLLRAAGDPAGQSRSLQGIANVLRHAGEPERARVLLEEALSLDEATGRVRDELSAWGARALIARDAGRLPAARELLLKAEPLAGSPGEHARVYDGLAQVELQSGQAAAARRQVGQVMALPLAPTHSLREQAWLHLAEIEARERRDDAASGAYARALSLAEQRGSEIEQGDVLSARARFLLARHRPGDALRDTDRAIRLLESVGADGMPPQQRAVFLATRRRVYESQIAAQLELAQMAGDAAEAGRQRQAALETSERSRMGRLIAGLAAPRGVVPEALAGRREALFELLAGKRQRIETLQDAATANSEALARLSGDAEALRAELDTVEAQIARRTGGTTSGSTAVARVDLSTIVPADTAVLEYFVGENQGWVFVVGRGQVAAQALPSPARLDAAVRKLLAQWTTPSGQAAVASDELSGIFPIEAAAAGWPAQLWFVPDGVLHALPLAALANELDHDRRRDEIEMAIVPSLRAVAVATTRAVTMQKGPDRILLEVVADPIFEANDPRIARRTDAGKAPDRAPPGAVLQTAIATRLDLLRRLPATADEARAVAGLLPDGSARILTGADATPAALLGRQLAGIRYLHFATHSLADAQDPQLSALVLSRFGPDGVPRDGVLRALDVADLDLDADLVVLSGCDTALGREIRGEGQVGMSDAFLRAGARSVLASLWRVPDTATAVLMVEFYRQLLVEHAPPSAALRHAQLFVRSQPRWSAPYYWAGFQLTSVDPDQRVATRK